MFRAIRAYHSGWQADAEDPIGRPEGAPRSVTAWEERIVRFVFLGGDRGSLPGGAKPAFEGFQKCRYDDLS
jgi:hypothetical protein